MRKNKHHIAVFEHECLRLGQIVDENSFDQDILLALQKHYGEKGVPYYSLIHKGIKFCEYVGVLQIGKTTIEVLPKADKAGSKDVWRTKLIGMLQAVGIFKIESRNSSSLKLKRNSILDLYFELFINEVESLIHHGLVKQYRKTTGQQKALKGSIQFHKQVQHNLVHKERFYVKHISYDTQHLLHEILFQALILLKRINTNSILSSKIGAILLDYPEMSGIQITESTFERLTFNRKTESYRHAIEIARLLLLNYHPDIQRGQNDVLALMFDMNLLWEQFVYVSIRKFKDKETTVTAQTSKYFWKPENGRSTTMRPDIVINKGKDNCLVLDTKWKNINGLNPSSDDLRQMYVYQKYYNANKVALVYPGNKNLVSGGRYFIEDKNIPGDAECSLISLRCEDGIREWQFSISQYIQSWQIPSHFTSL